MNSNTSCHKFYNEITKLLDEMAPYKKLTKKELSLKQKPWISPGILKSMTVRDKLYMDFTIQSDQDRKEAIFKRYKKYRNMIISLIRKNKKKHYSDFFLEHNANIKKPGKESGSLLTSTKRKLSVSD